MVEVIRNYDGAHDFEEIDSLEASRELDHGQDEEALWGGALFRPTLR